MEKLSISELLDFCRDSGRHQLEWDAGFHHVLVKVHVKKQIVALYHQYFSGDEERQFFATEGKMEIDGFYHFGQDHIYNLAYRLGCYIDGYTEYLAFPAPAELNSACEKLKKAVCKKMMIKYPEFSGQEMDPLGTKDLVDNAFFSDNTPESLVFRLNTDVNLCDKTLDDYLSGPDNWVEAESNKLLSDPEILCKYLKQLDIYYLVKEQLKNLLDNKADRRHRIKALRDCVADKKTVTVNLLRDGKKMTCKVDAKFFFDRDGNYHFDWGIASAYKKEYISTFGYDSMTIEDIESVLYGKKVIYKKF